jgi:hypothetical protein
MEPDNVFGDLRAMSRQAPSEKSFLAIVRALDAEFAHAPNEAASRVLPFAVDALSLVDVGCFRGERLVAMYRRAERAGLRRFDLYLPNTDWELEEVWWAGQSPPRASTSSSRSRTCSGLKRACLSRPVHDTALHSRRNVREVDAPRPAPRHDEPETTP